MSYYNRSKCLITVQTSSGAQKGSKNAKACFGVSNLFVLTVNFEVGNEDISTGMYNGGQS